MQVLDRPTVQTAAPLDNASMRQFQHFLDELLSIPSVKKIAWATDADPWALWVMFEHEDLEHHERVHDLFYDFRHEAGTAPPVDVHVVVLDRVPEAALPPTKFDIRPPSR